jgi:hypothetical protein
LTARSYLFGPAYSTSAAFFIASTTAPARMSTVVFVARMCPGDIAPSTNVVSLTM